VIYLYHKPIKNKQKGDLEMENLLIKFDNIKIENEERISREDKEFCELQEKVYFKGKEVYLNFINQIKQLKTEAEEIGEKYKTVIERFTYKQETALYHSYSVGDLENIINKMKNKFISIIISYFQTNYNVTFECEKIQEKYKNTLNITYNIILDEIFNALGGLTFIEKESKEIKEKIKENTKNYREDESKVKLNKTKISIDSYVYIDSWDVKWGGLPKVHYNSEDQLYSIIKGLKHYSEGTVNLTNNEKSFIRSELREKIGDYKDLSYNKVKNIKIFKNGKCEINFISSQDALTFAKEYCGYIEK
jgi:hypothetical protein